MKLKIESQAFEKLRFMRDKSLNCGGYEVGGWFISSPDDPFVCVDFFIQKQIVSCVSVDFDNKGTADFVRKMAELEIYPDRCQKIWVHTHPFENSNPSKVDRDTFKRMVSKLEMKDWMIMFILASDNSNYCRFAIKTEFGILSTQIDIEILVENRQDWDKEFTANVSFQPDDDNYLVNWMDFPGLAFELNIDSFSDVDSATLLNFAQTKGLSVNQLIRIEEEYKQRHYGGEIK